MAAAQIANADEFGNAVVSFARDFTPRQASLFHRNISLRALRGIVRRTPVDTGRARGNWQTSVGAPADGVLYVDDKTGDGANARGDNATDGLPPFTTVWISNNLPYIEPLENGHSKQQPNGMVGATLADLAAGLNEAAARDRSAS